MAGQYSDARYESPRIKVRIESLSDLVFGLALSIGSIILVGRVPQNGLDLLTNILLFGFSFLVIVMIWVGYSRTMAVLPLESPLALYTNLGLLFCVALDPYLFYVMQSNPSFDVLNVASMAYGIDVGIMFLLLAELIRLVMREASAVPSDRGRRIHPQVVRRLSGIMKAELAAGAVFVISALPVFWVDTPIGQLRFVLWYSAFVIFGGQRLAYRSGRREDGAQGLSPSNPSLLRLSLIVLFGQTRPQLDSQGRTILS